MMIVTIPKKTKLFIFICCVCFLLFGLIYYIFMKDTEVNSKVEPIELQMDNKLETDMEEVNVEEETKVTMFVDVKGAVKKEGVYEVDQGMRVKDVLNQAGGFTDDADHKQVNLAQKVSDEMIIYVPRVGEVVETNHQILPSTEENRKISLNKATLEELQTLTGIGPAKAAAIISYREEFGPFKDINELLSVSGIGEKSFEKIKDELTLN
ncbi:helix-hairpin-helix domain-containing protein [Fredinandcohnia humi]